MNLGGTDLQSITNSRVLLARARVSGNLMILLISEAESYFVFGEGKNRGIFTANLFCLGMICHKHFVHW